MESQQGQSGTSIPGRDSRIGRKRRQDFRAGGSQGWQGRGERRRSASAGGEPSGSGPAAAKNATGIVPRVNPGEPP